MIRTPTVKIIRGPGFVNLDKCITLNINAFGVLLSFVSFAKLGTNSVLTNSESDSEIKLFLLMLITILCGNMHVYTHKTFFQQ